MRKYLGNIASLWLGFSLSAFCHVGIFDWQFWAVVVPTLLLFAFKED